MKTRRFLVCAAAAVAVAIAAPHPARGATQLVGARQFPLTLDYLKGVVATEVAETATDGNPFKDDLDALKRLQQRFAATMQEYRKTRAKTAGSTIPGEAIGQSDAIMDLDGALSLLEDEVRADVARVVDCAVRVKLPHSHTRLEVIVNCLERWKYSEQILAFDRAWGEAMHNIDLMTLNRTAGEVTYSELLMASRFDKFARQLTPWTEPEFDRKMSVLDRYLHSIRDSELSRIHDDIKPLFTAVELARASIEAAETELRKSRRKSYPAVEPILKNYKRLVDEADETYYATIKLLNNVESDSTETGKLRRLVDGPNGAWKVSGGAKSDGEQGYAKRADAAVEKVFRRYHNAARAASR